LGQTLAPPHIEGASCPQWKDDIFKLFEPNEGDPDVTMLLKFEEAADEVERRMRKATDHKASDFPEDCSNGLEPSKGKVVFLLRERSCFLFCFL